MARINTLHHKSKWVTFTDGDQEVSHVNTDNVCGITLDEKTIVFSLISGNTVTWNYPNKELAEASMQNLSEKFYG